MNEVRKVEVTEVVLVPTHLTDRGQRYEVYLGDELLVKSSRDPEHDAARALRARGITGVMKSVRAPGGPVHMLFDIETAAEFTIVEDKRGLNVHRWKADSRWAG